jgi:hypothetical protein
LKLVTDDGLRFLEDTVQMIRSPVALRINLVDVFRSGRTRREPSTLGHDFQPADGFAVAGSLSEDCLNFFARQLGQLYLPG